MVELTDVGSALVVALAVSLGFALSIVQAFIGAKVGTDHPVHVFLTRGIRNNGNRLFVRIPKLLNTCYCAAMPLYLHWIVAHFQSRAVFWSERLLNPTVNTLHVVLFALIAALTARAEGLPPGFVGLATCAFALTPQFFHALSARNFGLSSRGSGLFLLTLFFLAAYEVEAGFEPLVAWPLLIIAGWLVWGFSTFAQQALCILGVLLFVLTGRHVALLGAALGLGVFIAIHPKYSLSYLRNTLRYIHTYATEMAAIYILDRRKSIWRDLVWDIWTRFAAAGPTKALHYAYENSVIIVALLNPLVVLACWAVTAGPADGLLGYSAALSLAGAIAVLLTSFRPTRFLGEPERYAEVVTPWATLAGANLIQAQGGTTALTVVVSLFLAVDLLQLFASKKLLRHVAGNDLGLADIERVVDERLGRNVRFCSNNEQITKKLMQNDWQFAYYLAGGQEYCGLTASQIFSKYPYLRRAACELVVSTYRVNACLLDRQLYETLFDTPLTALRNMSTAWQSDRFRLLILDWDPALPSSERSGSSE